MDGVRKADLEIPGEQGTAAAKPAVKAILQ
jgi:hypothetical protein